MIDSNEESSRGIIVVEQSEKTNIATLDKYSLKSKLEELILVGPKACFERAKSK